MGQAVERATFSAVFAVGEFRALWAAEVFSIAGDQLARVALAVLVYARTNSATLTGLTYALTFVPGFLGGALLGGIGDRYPRRAVMIVADIARAVLVALMAIPGTPLGVLCTLVAAVTLLGGPFKAAQQALLPTLLPGEKLLMGQSIRTITTQSAQLIGFAGGGALVAAVDPTVGLLMDAGTFLLSAAIVRLGVRARPAPTAGTATATSGPRRYLASTIEAARHVRQDPGLRALLALSCLAGIYIAPEALAAPYAASMGGGASAVGLIMASDPAGSVIGAFVFAKWVPEPFRIRVIGLLGVVAGLPLMLCVLRPGLLVSMLLFATLGALITASIMQSNTTFTVGFPDSQRGQASGLFWSGLITAQGLGALIAGVLTDWIGPAPTIALAGAAGAIGAVPIAVGWHRNQHGAVQTNPVAM